MQILSSVLSFLGLAGDPASPADGDMWFNSTQKCHKSDVPMGVLGNVGLAKAQTSVQAGDTVANTTTETNFATNFSIPAGALAVGKVIRLTASGVYGTTTTGPTLVVRVKAGTTVLAATASVALGTSQTNQTWQLTCNLVVTAIGASGAVEAQGMATLSLSAPQTVLSARSMANTAVVTVNTTTAQTLQISVQFGTANASNTITMRQFTVEVLN